MRRIIETITQYSCLGIRFWDPVAGDCVQDDLTVTARPATATRPVKTAVRTHSGVYAFNNLPGLREIEQGGYGDYPVASPPVQKRFVVEIRDRLGRFVDVGFSVDLPLPYNGLYLLRPQNSPPSSPPNSIPRGFNLYSAITRTPPSMIVAIRGELLDADTGKPAAHAVVCIITEDGFEWHGLADVHGRFVTLMPYPTLIDAIGGSPAVQNKRPLHEQTWPLSIEVRYAPKSVQPLPYSTLKEYSSVLSQPPARIWPTAPGNGRAPMTKQDVRLYYGKDVILKTAGQSKLMVSPATSPPS